MDETIGALVIDWDAAVPAADDAASSLYARLEELRRAGVHVFVMTAAPIEGLEGRFRQRSPAADPPDPSAGSAGGRGVEAAGHLFVCRPDGGDVIEITGAGSELAERQDLGGPPHSTGFAPAWLAQRGIAGALVLVAGRPADLGAAGGSAGSAGSGGSGGTSSLATAFERASFVDIGGADATAPISGRGRDGGRGRLDAVIDEQLGRRRQGRVPGVDRDPRWVIPLPGDPGAERVAESLGTLANGWVGTRANREETGQGSAPLFLVAGTYTGSGRLAQAAIWTALDWARPDGSGGTEERLLDLRTGTLERCVGPVGESGGAPHAFRSLRFVSQADRHVMAMRAEGPPDDLMPGPALRPSPTAVDGDGDVELAVAERAGFQVARVVSTPGEDAGVTVAACDNVTELGPRRVVERLATWVGNQELPHGDRAPHASPDGFVERALGQMAQHGFDALLASHREAWARRWMDAEVVIDGAPADELAARFAVFHLLSSAASCGEAAVGARGLSGPAYAGHVFWDADVFVLPALAAIAPQAARAMLEYRIRRLPAARLTAASAGRRGARFPWESARDGTDVTPRIVPGPHGDPVEVATGLREEHIVADVAWAAMLYARWTGDAAFLAGPGRDLVVDTARYWASRMRVDAGGHGHLDAVMGPDEYHERVDDNAYTNLMARWNLRAGADLLSAHPGDDGRGGAPGEAAAVPEAAIWRRLAAQLVDGWDAERGIYEQFAGYFALEPLLLTEICKPPVAVDVLLGHERVASSQLIKQADVLMLYHLLPEEVIPRSLAPTLDFYGPRTAHGSSLSPAIHASLLARAGRTEEALDLFRLAARLDLDDLTGTTAGGVHLATMGGLWQALAYGFLGLLAHGDVLAIDPRLPRAWTGLGMRMRFRGRRVGVHARPDRVEITCDAPLAVQVGGGDVRVCEPPAETVAMGGKRHSVLRSRRSGS